MHPEPACKNCAKGFALQLRVVSLVEVKLKAPKCKTLGGKMQVTGLLTPLNLKCATCTGTAMKLY